MTTFDDIMSEQETTLKEAIKLKELADGRYIMTDYEFKTNSIGHSYITTCLDESGNSYRCWTNSYMYKFLSERKPRKKFAFITKDGRITIPGYSPKVVLS